MFLLLLIEIFSSASNVALESEKKTTSVGRWVWSSKCWCVNSVAEMRAEISASKFEQVLPQASLKSETVPSGNLKWTPKIEDIC